MKIMLIGYGKMGKAIHQIALDRGNEVPVIIDTQNIQDLTKYTGNDVDVAIEFTEPKGAYQNIRYCLENGIPVVSGTTGWLDKKEEIEAICKTNGGAFFYASNFSVGVNLFFKLNKVLASMMANQPQYRVATEEIHHTQKKDAPSGTAITVAEGILENMPHKNKWVNQESLALDELPIISKRMDPFPGQHTVNYHSMIDSISIQHTAHSREGFATGAVLAAEFIYNKQGVFGMDDLLKF